MIYLGGSLDLIVTSEIVHGGYCCDGFPAPSPQVAQLVRVTSLGQTTLVAVEQEAAKRGVSVAFAQKWGGGSVRCNDPAVFASPSVETQVPIQDES